MKLTVLRLGSWTLGSWTDAHAFDLAPAAQFVAFGSLTRKSAEGEPC